MSNVYKPQNLVRLKVPFTQADNGDPVDPSVVTLNIMDPNAALTTLVYGGGDIVRDSVGVYHYDLLVVTAGTWYYQWVGTGSVEAADEESFVVEWSHFS